MRYSPSTRGFYASEIDYAALPSDLVEVSDEQHQALLVAQASGKVIVPVNGVPVAQDPAPQDIGEWRATAKASRYQAKEQLRRDGLLPAALAIVAAAGPAVQLAWDEAGEFRRASPMINSMAPLLWPGLTGEALELRKDQFIQDAAGIEA